MEIQKVKATVRTKTGKGSSRSLRTNGHIPAICYGGDNETLHLVVDPKELLNVLRSEYGRNSVIQLEVSGKDERHVMIQDSQIHPVKRNLLHVDFIAVDLDSEVEVRVPVECTGRAIGVQMGGELIQVFREIPVKALPADIPSSIELDISALEMGQSINASAVELPGNVKLMLDPQQTIVSVGAPRKEEEEEKPEEEGEEAAGEEGAEGEEGAAEEGEKKESGDKADKKE